MVFDFAKLKARTRKVVHDTLSVDSLYQQNEGSTPVSVKVRWHNKIELQGDLNYQGYAEVLEGIDRLIFNVVDARKLNIQRGGKITITAYAEFKDNISGATTPCFTLDSKVPNTGLHNEIWLVTRS